MLTNTPTAIPNTSTDTTSPATRNLVCVCLPLHVPQHRIHRRFMRRVNLGPHGRIGHRGEDRHRLRRRERHFIATHRLLTECTTQHHTRQRIDTSQHRNELAIINFPRQTQLCGGVCEIAVG